MLCCKRIGWVFFVLCMWVFGCSSLHVETSSSFNWGEVGTVSVQQPQTDPWNLLPAIYNELATMGVDSSVDAERADLILQFSVQEGPDIDSQGNIYNRLNSLHLQFIDPNDERIIAVTDYFYSDTDIEHTKGVKAAFAGLKKRLAEKRSELASQPATVDSNSAQQLAPIAVDEEQTDFQMQDEKKTIQPETPTESSLTVETPTHSAPVQSVTENIVPQTESPWIPRLKSWGFENWGKQSAEDDGY